MSLINLIFNRKKIENPAKITLKNIRKYLQGNFYLVLLKIPFLSKRIVSNSRMEQYEWRRKCVQEKSPECLEKGECFCGCSTEGLLLADPACEQKNKCFPAIMSAAEWQRYKMKNNI